MLKTTTISCSRIMAENNFAHEDISDLREHGTCVDETW